MWPNKSELAIVIITHFTSQVLLFAMKKLQHRTGKFSKDATFICVCVVCVQVFPRIVYNNMKTARKLNSLQSAVVCLFGIKVVFQTLLQCRPLGRAVVLLNKPKHETELSLNKHRMLKSFI